MCEFVRQDVYREEKERALEVVIVHPKEYEWVPEASHYLTASATLIL